VRPSNAAAAISDDPTAQTLESCAMPGRRLALIGLLMLLSVGSARGDQSGRPTSNDGAAPATPPDAPVPLRLHGVIEPVSSYAVAVPRLAAGQPGPPAQLVVIRLIASGTVVKKGDVLVEFDRQAQLKNARDREADYQDFLQQLRKKHAEVRAARARRDSERLQAQTAVRSAELDLLGVELLPKIQAEKNQQALDEAGAHHAALLETQALKEKVEAADLRILEIQRDRALNAWRNAERNAERMLILAPIDGLVVLKTIWKSGTMAVVQEGEEVRSGTPLLDVVDPSAMRVRALVNQADVARVSVGQAAKVTLDSYPARSFDARLQQLSPVATTSTLNPRVRSFLAVFAIDASDDHLLPDLAAAVDVLAPTAAATAAGASR
jgi:HlyD family secretion protein